MKEYKDVRYGPHERNALDFYQVDSDKPAPAVIWFPGGAFRVCDRTGSIPFMDLFLGAGISIASADYRLRQDAPFPAPMLDGARAVQFLRAMACEWNIDAGAIGACGNSAGGQIALWVAFHKDLADGGAGDPVARRSSRVAAVAGDDTQTTMDPRVLPGLIGMVPDQWEFWGICPGEVDTPKALRIFEESSPIAHASKDNPPVFLTYRRGMAPITPELDRGHKIHHPAFGKLLKEKLDSLGVECTWTCPGDGKSNDQRGYWQMMVEFFLRHLRRN